MREANYQEPSAEEQADIDHMYEVVDACETLEDFRSCDLLTERSDEFVLSNQGRMYFAVVEDEDGDHIAIATMSVQAYEGKIWFVTHDENGEPNVLGGEPGRITFFSVKRLDADFESGGKMVRYDPIEDRIIAAH